MKRELKIGDSQIITITDDDLVTVPDEVRMNMSEIANLLGIYYQAVKKCIRAIEKSGIVSGDYSMCCTVEGLKVYPEYYGLDMIIAVAFRVQSTKAEVFRKWITRRITESGLPRTIILSLQNSMLN